MTWEGVSSKGSEDGDLMLKAAGCSPVLTLISALPRELCDLEQILSLAVSPVLRSGRKGQLLDQKALRASSVLVFWLSIDQGTTDLRHGMS